MRPAHSRGDHQLDYDYDNDNDNDNDDDRDAKGVP